MLPAAAPAISDTAASTALYASVKTSSLNARLYR
jgi:hypothetical protein